MNIDSNTNTTADRYIINNLARGVNPNNTNEDNTFVAPLFARRLSVSNYPRSSVLRPSNYGRYRHAQVTRLEALAGTKVEVLKDPYTRLDKIKFQDAYTNDSMVRRCINLYVKFLLGKRTNTVIDINKEFTTPEMQEQVLSNTFNEAEINELKTWFDRINRRVKFHKKIQAAVTQAAVGGRSALFIETQQGGVPVELKITNWQKLGAIFVDKGTWQMLAVETGDRSKDDPFLADEIIYFSNLDYNIRPDSLYHGISDVEPVADMAETLRYAVSEDLKEAMRSAWAKSGMIKFPPNISKAKADELLAMFQPGIWNATSQDVKIETFDLDPKIQQMIDLIVEGQRYIYRGIGVPGGIVGFEDIQNRATMDLVLNGWRESDLNDRRTWLQDTLEPQWFDSLLKIRYPDINLKDMKVKAKLEFEDVTFETLKDKSEALIPLYQAGVIPLEKMLKLLDMEDVLEEVLAKQRQLEKQRKDELEMMRLEREKRLAEQPTAEEDDTVEEDKRKKEEEQTAALVGKAVTITKQQVMDQIMQDIPKQTQPPVEHNQEEDISKNATLLDLELQMKKELHQRKLKESEDFQKIMTSLNSKIEDLSSSD